MRFEKNDEPPGESSLHGYSEWSWKQKLKGHEVPMIFGLPGISGVGISFGADRIYDVLNELNLFPQNTNAGVKVLIINFGNETLAVCLKTLQSLRDAGIAAEMYPQNAKIKNQFEYANKKNIPYTLVIGTEEATKGVCKLKNMDSGEQKEASLAEAIVELS